MVPRVFKLPSSRLKPLALCRCSMAQENPDMFPTFACDSDV